MLRLAANRLTEIAPKDLLRFVPPDRADNELVSGGPTAKY